MLARRAEKPCVVAVGEYVRMPPGRSIPAVRRTMCRDVRVIPGMGHLTTPRDEYGGSARSDRASGSRRPGMATTQSDWTGLGRTVMKPTTTPMRVIGLVSGCCLVLLGCNTTTSDVAAPPYSDPPADCSPVHAVGEDSVSSFAGVPVLLAEYSGTASTRTDLGSSTRSRMFFSPKQFRTCHLATHWISGAVTAATRCGSPARDSTSPPPIRPTSGSR